MYHDTLPHHVDSLYMNLQSRHSGTQHLQYDGRETKVRRVFHTAFPVLKLLRARNWVKSCPMSQATAIFDNPSSAIHVSKKHSVHLIIETP
jgi:hypothetical protein